MVERLSACSLVCRAWRIRAQALLFERIVLNHEGLPSLDRVLRENHVVCSSITEMYVQGESKTTSFSFFAIRHQLPNLTYLNIHQLDLTREHPWLYRAPLFRSVQRLKLYRLKPCQLSQLVLFINSFYSLVRLDLDFDFAQLEHRDQILPKPSCIDTRSLIWIELDLNPGVSRLIFWFLKAKPLLERLKTLVLYIWGIEDETDFESSIEGVDRLLDSCRKSIEDLRLHLGTVPMVESFSDLGQYVLLTSVPYLTVISSAIIPFSQSEMHHIRVSGQGLRATPRRSPARKCHFHLWAYSN